MFMTLINFLGTSKTMAMVSYIYVCMIQCLILNILSKHTEIFTSP